MIQKNGELLNHFVFEDKTFLGIGENDYIFQSDDETKMNILNDLRKMNIFVGANNSGKSRVLRAIFFQLKLMDLQLAEDLKSYIVELNLLIASSRVARGQLPQTNKFISSVNTEQNKDFWEFNESLISAFHDAINEMQGVIKNPGFFTQNGSPTFHTEMITFLENNKELYSTLTSPSKRYRLYIPTLRGLRPVGSNDPYRERTNNDYFKGRLDDKKHDIFSGDTIYKEIRKKLLGKQSDRDFVQEYQEFLSENFFENAKITLIPRETNDLEEVNDVVYITFNNHEGKERPIFQLGDGIQTIICLTYPLFSWLKQYKNEEDSYLLACIEEPELYLHPSMQQKLIKVLMSERFKKIQYFVTTHSNHFISLINDEEFANRISIYSIVQKDNTKIVSGENNLSETVYGLLGAKPSSLLLANKTIWIEGVSDRIYLRHAIKLYLEDNKKDRGFKKPSEYSDYAFVEYGGSNLDHYFTGEEVDLKISNLSNLKNVFLLVDEDGTNQKRKVVSAKTERYDRAKDHIVEGGGTFSKTHGREIENYISPEVLNKIYPEFKATSAAYKNSNLHTFLFKNGITRYIKPAGKGFQDKVDFAIKITEQQKAYSDLSDEMKLLVNDLYNFIVS